jgi:hypothetical protein
MDDFNNNLLLIQTLLLISEEYCKIIIFFNIDIPKSKDILKYGLLIISIIEH